MRRRVLLSFVAAALLGPGSGPAGAQAKGPRLAVEPERFDFGDALPQKRLTKEFSLRNFGSEDLVIQSIATTCGCTAALLDEKNKVIKPGASAPLRVDLETRTVRGKLARSVLIRSNDAQKPTYELRVEANVVAAEKAEK